MPILQPGDALVCVGNSVISHLIRLKSHHSHVAIAASAVPAIVAESTSQSNLPDLETGELLTGVQSHFLPDWLQAYDGDVWHYPLRDPLTQQESFNLGTWLESEYRHRIGYDWPGVMGIGFELLTGLNLRMEPDLGHVFCSEMYTQALQAIGRLDPNIRAQEQTPDDVTQFLIFNAPVKLKGMAARALMLTKPRSPHWPVVEKAHKAWQPDCQVCGTKDKVEVHHLMPFHLDPSLELDEKNLLSLCRPHHFTFGHLNSWECFNPSCVDDCLVWRKRIAERK